MLLFGIQLSCMMTSFIYAFADNFFSTIHSL